MIKVVAVFALVAVIGGVLYLALSPFLPELGSAIPNIQSLFVTAQEQVQPVITYVQENAQLVGGTTVAVGGIGTWIANKIYKSNIQKKEIEVTAKMNEVQGQYFQLDAEKRGLENALEQSQGKITMLEDGATNVKTLSDQLQAKVSEVEKLTAEKNALERLFPNVKTAEQMIKEAQQVP